MQRGESGAWQELVDSLLLMIDRIYGGGVPGRGVHDAADGRQKGSSPAAAAHWIIPRRIHLS